MFHDPEVYDRPEDFWPDRWILREFGTKPGVDETDRRNNIWYGSGRRLCAGFHLATNSLVREFQVCSPYRLTSYNSWSTLRT
jgi:cytochrome P450